MALPDPEALRNEYNRNYSSGVDTWSCHDRTEADRIVATIEAGYATGHITRPHGAAMLDVGCARGHISDAFQRAGWSVLGIDYSEVAVAAARAAFPACTFRHTDGTRPQFDQSFDMILIRGFSACNTLDLAALATLCNRYMTFLNDAGMLVLGHSTDFSGLHRPGDTACWSRSQIEDLVNQFNGRLVHIEYVPKVSAAVRIKLRLGRLIGRRTKIYFYLFVQKNSSVLRAR